MEKSTSFQGALSTLFNVYAKKTDPFIKLLDVFLVFLVFIGVVQFGYVVLVGTYPFNSFLSGFIAAVGQFVLTVSFRSQLIESSDPKLAKSAFSSKRFVAGFVSLSTTTVLCFNVANYFTELSWSTVSLVLCSTFLSLISLDKGNFRKFDKAKVEELNLLCSATLALLWTILTSVTLHE